MTTRFVSVTADDFRGLLHPQNGWIEKSQGNELVFDKQLNNGATLRVYTSVRFVTGYSREKGKDAIRVTAFLEGVRGLYKGPHIKRVRGWQDRVKDRVWDAFITVKEKNLV